MRIADTVCRPKASNQPGKSDQVRQIERKKLFRSSNVSLAGTSDKPSSRLQARLGMVVANYAPPPPPRACGNYTDRWWRWLVRGHVYDSILKIFEPSLANETTWEIGPLIPSPFGGRNSEVWLYNPITEKIYPKCFKSFFWFCRTWTKRYLITSQTRVKRNGRIHHRTILRMDGPDEDGSVMVRWCIRLTRLTLVCEVIRYRLVQVRQNQKKTFRVGGPQAPFSISSSFILSFVLLPFFLNTKMLQVPKDFNSNQR